jgi:membrane protein required for colicin V production
MFLDIIVLAVMFVSAVIACLRGFIREVLTIMGVLGGTIAALKFGGKLAPFMLGLITPKDLKPDEKPEKIMGVIPPELMADIMAYGAIFISVVIILSIISHFLANAARGLGLGSVDRSFGVVFGLVRGFVILALIYTLIYSIFDKETRMGWFEGSRTQPYLEGAARWVESKIPANAKADLQEKADNQARDARRAVVDDARSRLLQLEGLRSDEPATPEPQEGDQGAGYNQNERRDLNELILENVSE